VICEEIAFMDIQLLYKVVLPTLARSGVAFIGISTLDDPFSFWTQMIDLKDDDGRPVFKTIRYTLVCDDCIKKGIETTCKHKMGDLPYWQDESQHNKLEKIMQDRAEAFLTETKGLLSNPNIRPAFIKKDIEFWMKRLSISNIKPRASIFVSIDPAAGGSMSDYAIVSMAFVDQKAIVIFKKKKKVNKLVVFFIFFKSMLYYFGFWMIGKSFRLLHDL